MAGLGNTDYHVVYKEVPVLKAFSSMFIATQQLACSMLWHFVVDPSGQRVPYSTVLDYHRDDSAIEDFGTTNVTRNFVGWTSSIRRLAGKFRLHPRLTQYIWLWTLGLGCSR
jgi:hypothetical protein